MAYSCYKLHDECKNKLLEIYPPKHANVICDHVTHRFPDSDFPPKVESAKIIGYASNDKIEAFVVEINGTMFRPDGKIYHLTYSLNRNKGAKPVHSNKLIADGFELLGSTLEIAVKAYLTF